MLGMAPKARGTRAWSWENVRLRTLAIYRSNQAGRERTAVLVWQGDEPRVAVGGSTSALLAITVDAEDEAVSGNVVAISAFDSLEAARARCIEWAGEDLEVGWDSLGEATQVGVYAAIREPGFAGG